MFNVRHDFGFIGRLFGVPRSWLSKVGAFVSSFSTRGQLLQLSVPDNPDPASAPVTISINEAALRAFVLANAPTPEDVVIPDNVLTTDDIGSSVANVTHTHYTSDLRIGTAVNSRQIVAFEPNSSTASPKPTSYFIGYGSSDFAAGNHLHTGVYQPAGVAVPYSHSHDLGNITGSNNQAYRRFLALPKNASNSAVTLGGIYSGDIRMSEAKNYKCIVAFPESSLTASAQKLSDFIDITDLKCTISGHSGNCLLVVQNDGSVTHSGNAMYDALSAIANLSGDGLLRLNSDNSFSVEPLSPSDPSSSTSISPTSDAANNSTWTANASNGLAIRQLVRTKYVTSGTSPVLYAYYRTVTYDKYGRLYSISAESRETIDSTLLITWS